MKITRKQIVTTVVGTVLVIPCVALGKVIGVGFGALCGVAAAYSVVDLAYDEVTKFLESRKQEQ